MTQNQPGTRVSKEPFDDLLQEIRVLLSGSQVLTAFLVTVPFSSGFARLSRPERWIYAVTFLTALLSLVLFATPAAHHRLAWPIRDREQFKRFATRLVITGLIPLSVSLIFATHFVLTEAIGKHWTTWATSLVAVVILILWWGAPLFFRLKQEDESSPRV
ncbi:DUF6328 family protein [Deinococcus oregonensis]|uniref:DUF6328 family protein n=1 Tax=Deinococcus oregonensis TaxID=1805970 RepID=A0ABV6B4G0_9DEIO